MAVVRRQHKLIGPCPVSVSGTVADAPNQKALLTAFFGCGADCLTRESVVQGGARQLSLSLTSVSPFSFVRLAGRPDARASSSTSLFPSRAALYIWAASRIASRDGEKAVADVRSVLILGSGCLRVQVLGLEWDGRYWQCRQVVWTSDMETLG